MTVKFSVAAFAEAAKAIRNVPGGTREIDILDHARLHATKKKGMTLTMSDLDVEARVSLPCEADTEVLAAVPRAVLEFFIAREGSGEDTGTLDFDADMRAVVARHGKARLNMPILKGEDFYLIDAPKPGWSLTLRAHELCGVLKRCEKALGADANRIMLHGPFLHRLPNSADGAVKVIGSDSSRIHIIDVDDPALSGDLPTRDGAELPGIIIPPKTVKEILRIFGGDESELKLSGTDKVMLVEAERLRIASKLIDATYFDYPKLIPARPEPHVTIGADQLVRAMDGLLVVPKNDAKGRRETSRTIRLTIREKSIELFAKGDAGDAEDEIEVTNDGVADGTAMTFDARYLRDVIEAAGAAKIALHPPADFGMPFHVAAGDGCAFIIGQRRM
ncbi:DNA polymerase III subunit beta [Mesorhizobium sp.]|uniref:DNA polymerase III subunit beta n=1 Tax=Mesorhizobium sp. TaxID=1871066 RepID=UPI000FE6239C|nr:DNA polymerase III subunit beta [Mesorhizobium sp.]RWN11789.1 MAG: hypothetical protein EOR87_14835 [Mesorhizobium sp.]RWN19424.1 MAG: hypothetical protein EOR88_09730 [Mesorhizobium sp.]